MSSFLEDIEFASKVSEAIKEAEKRGMDNSIELTKEMIKQQYGDVEEYKKTIKIQFEMINELNEKIDKAIEILHSMKHCELLLGGYKKSNIDKLLEILGDKE